MRKVILSNQVKCLNCGDEPYSAYTHDFKYCECGRVFVDGGMDYIRTGYMSNTEVIDLSIEVDDITLGMCLSALDWCDENKKNNLGRVCAIFRALRDCGYLQGVKNDR